MASGCLQGVLRWLATQVCAWRTRVQVPRRSIFLSGGAAVWNMEISATLVDACADDFASRACAILFQHGFVRVKLDPTDALVSRKLYSAASAFFQDRDATRDSHIAPRERSRRDSRSGYVYERKWETGRMNENQETWQMNTHFVKNNYS